MRRISLVLTLLLAAAPAYADGSADMTTVYDHVTVIDGTGAAPLSDRTIVTAQGRIVAIVSSRNWRSALKDTDLSKVRVEDMHGDFALPGLIDTHVHLATDPDPVFERAELRRFIYSGVTTVRDMAGDTRVLAGLSRSALLNEIAAPEIYYAALMAGPQFFHDPRTVASAKGGVPGQVPWMRAITHDTDLKIAVAEAHGTGATALKIYADLPPDLVKAITAEAHRQHMLVWAHAAVFPSAPMDDVDADVDVMSHSCMLAYQPGPMPPEYHNRAPVNDALFVKGTALLDPLFAAMKEHHTILDATNYVYKIMWLVPNAQPAPYCHEDLAERITAAAHKAGVEISTGTDADSDWDKPFPSVFDEIGLLVHKSGFTPMEAIHAATFVGAEAVGQADKIGTLTPGKRANIVFVKKNPLVDIENLRGIDVTVKGNEVFRRSDYQPITKDEAKNEIGDP